MKRLFQFGAFVMLLGSVYPLLEFFDCWDRPGLSNDTEFKVYALLFAISFVLLLCKLISPASLKFRFLFSRVFPDEENLTALEAGHSFIFTVPPLSNIPLRI